jgi:hypothetical protein
MRRKAGISLLGLIIVVILIIILVWNGVKLLFKKPKETNNTNFISDFALVQKEVTTRRSEFLIQYETNPDLVETNAGFSRTKVVGPPQGFESFPLKAGEEGTTQGYLVDLGKINLDYISIGQAYKTATEIQFDSTDAFVYDAKGEVYYAKGYYEKGKKYYSLADLIIKKTNNAEANNVISFKGVNAPVLGNGMIPVYWDESNREISFQSSGYRANDWYNYRAQIGDTTSGGSSNWANAKTADGSYFVWIPRFAYKITYYTNFDKKTISETRTDFGDIDILFLDGISNKYIDRTSGDKLDLPTGYKVHPAFTKDIANGGGDKEITGFWIGKFESSHSDSSSTSIGTSNSIKIVPGVKSWGNSNIGNFFTRAKAYNVALNSHLIKNSEWGAVAYLAYSKYGRNGTEVTINNNADLLTGYAGERISDNYSATKTFLYNTPEGQLASTTGNIFGVYDMSGGLWEYVSAYYSGSTSDDLTKNGGAFVYQTGSESAINSAGNFLATAYGGTDETKDYKIGDATYETTTWNDDSNNFITSTHPFFARGGNINDTINSGIFYYQRSTGDGSPNYGFRICLIP